MLLRTAGRDSEGTAGASVHLERTAFIWSVRNLHAVYGFQNRLFGSGGYAGGDSDIPCHGYKRKKDKGDCLVYRNDGLLCSVVFPRSIYCPENFSGHVWQYFQI
ncbi:MAG TPA: hypothetical protein DCZ40_03075 [Lachnospiraceae bacterium]|nr:hypothetical protein [Lachnospiraceae bacterium]